MDILKTTLQLRTLCVLAMLAMLGVIQAQDIHFSQFGNAPLQRSPALTGVFDGDMRITGNYRAQWYDVPVSYRTVNGTFDKRFLGEEERSGYFSAGLVFNYDEAGDSRLNTTTLGLNGSYTRKITSTSYLSAGLQLAAYQRAFRTDKLKWDEQFDGKEYDSSLSPNEAALYANKSIFYADFSAGLNWHYQSNQQKTRQNGSQRRSRTSVDLGGGWFHINRPEVSFFDEEDIRLPARFSLYGLGIIDFGKRFDLLINAMGQYQGKAREHLISGAGRFHLNDDLTKEVALSLGLGYRFNDGFGQGDAVIPFAMLNYRSWQFGLSYDINISDFDTAANGLGGPELSLIYIIKKVPNVDFCPTCPTYL